MHNRIYKKLDTAIEKIIEGLEFVRVPDSFNRPETQAPLSTSYWTCPSELACTACRNFSTTCDIRTPDIAAFPGGRTFHDLGHNFPTTTHWLVLELRRCERCDSLAACEINCNFAGYIIIFRKNHDGKSPWTVDTSLDECEDTRSYRFRESRLLELSKPLLISELPRLTGALNDAWDCAARIAFLRRS